MDRVFGLRTVGLMEEGKSLTALYNLAVYMGSKVDIIEPTQPPEINSAESKYRLKIDGMDVHDGTGGITGFRGWGLTAEEAAENYFLSCADTLGDNIKMYKGLSDKCSAEFVNQSMGFCLDMDKNRRFDFITGMGTPLPSQAVRATVLQDSVKPLPVIKLKK